MKRTFRKAIALVLAATMALSMAFVGFAADNGSAEAQANGTVKITFTPNAEVGYTPDGKDVSFTKDTDSTTDFDIDDNTDWDGKTQLYTLLDNAGWDVSDRNNWQYWMTTDDNHFVVSMGGSDSHTVNDLYTAYETAPKTITLTPIHSDYMTELNVKYYGRDGEKVDGTVEDTDVRAVESRKCNAINTVTDVTTDIGDYVVSHSMYATSDNMTAMNAEYPEYNCIGFGINESGNKVNLTDNPDTTPSYDVVALDYDEVSSAWTETHDTYILDVFAKLEAKKTEMKFNPTGGKFSDGTITEKTAKISSADPYAPANLVPQSFNSDYTFVGWRDATNENFYPYYAEDGLNNKLNIKENETYYAVYAYDQFFKGYSVDGDGIYMNLVYNGVNAKILVDVTDEFNESEEKELVVSSDIFGIANNTFKFNISNKFFAKGDEAATPLGSQLQLPSALAKTEYLNKIDMSNVAKKTLENNKKYADQTEAANTFLKSYAYFGIALNEVMKDSSSSDVRPMTIVVINSDAKTIAEGLGAADDKLTYEVAGQGILTYSYEKNDGTTATGTDDYIVGVPYSLNDISVDAKWNYKSDYLEFKGWSYTQNAYVPDYGEDDVVVFESDTAKLYAVYGVKDGYIVTASGVIYSLNDTDKTATVVGVVQDTLTVNTSTSLKDAIASSKYGNWWDKADGIYNVRVLPTIGEYTVTEIKSKAFEDAKPVLVSDVIKLRFRLDLCSFSDEQLADLTVPDNMFGSNAKYTTDNKVLFANDELATKYEDNFTTGTKAFDEAVRGVHTIIAANAKTADSYEVNYAPGDTIIFPGLDEDGYYFAGEEVGSRPQSYTVTDATTMDVKCLNMNDDKTLSQYYTIDKDTEAIAASPNFVTLPPQDESYLYYEGGTYIITKQASETSAGEVEYFSPATWMKYETIKTAKLPATVYSVGGAEYDVVGIYDETSDAENFYNCYALDKIDATEWVEADFVGTSVEDYIFYVGLYRENPVHIVVDKAYYAENQTQLAAKEVELGNRIKFEQPYTVAYDLNGYSGTTTPSDADAMAYYNGDTNAVAGTANITNIPEGQSFLGWSTDKNATTAMYEPAAVYTFSAATASSDNVVTLYAIVSGEKPTPTTNGWKQAADGRWQYFENGVAATGWRNNIPGWNNWFYFDADGYMATGWQGNIAGWEGQWFFFDCTTGVMKTGWHFLPWSGGTNWFCFNVNNGVMYANCTTPDGYQVDANGVWVQK